MDGAAAGSSRKHRDTPDASADEVLDAYLDARLRGEARDLDEFCARFPALTPEARSRLQAVHDVAESGAAREPSHLVERPPERLGEFRVVRRLDEGGMGAVYLAEQESLRREVALKVLRPELRDSPSAESRLRREALALGRLRHPNIVSVYAVGEEGGVRFIAMELVPGRTLDEVLAEALSQGRTVGVERSLRWARDLARALQCAHEHGVIHRDVKPSNVRITPDDRPLLLDFGIARDANDAGATLTQTFAGSPLYAAPEQLSGAPLDGRADVYGLGATLYQCLTGRVPFEGGTMEQVLRRVLAEDPPPPRRFDPAIPRDAETVVLTALAKEPDARYASAAAFADDLDAVLTSRPIRAKPPGPLGRLAKWARRRPAPAAALVTVVLAALGWGAFALAQERAAATDRRGRAADAVGQARGRLEQYRSRRAQTDASRADLARLRRVDSIRYITDDEARSLASREGEVESFDRDRETSFQEVLELLRFAERMDADAAPAADGVRAELYRERWLDARAANDAAGADFYRRLVAGCDRDGRFATELRCVVRLHVTTDPPGARIHLLRCREQSEVVPGGERRIVPVPPAGATWPVAPGAFALRVAAAAGDLRPGDVVTSVAGAPADPATWRTFAAGTTASVWNGGALRETTLPEGVVLRPTWQPAFLSERSVVGTSPLRDVEIEEGIWLLVAEAPGRERVQHPCAFGPGQGSAVVELSLPPDGTTPAGFAAVQPQQGEAGAFALQEREVTSAEYLEFLNDAATLARIAASSDPILFPRSSRTRLEGGLWTRDASGRFALPADFPPDWPVIGVSFDDARAYAAWRTARAVAEGHADLEFALPTKLEWIWAGGFRAGRLYVFGHRFERRWTNGCWARPTASPLPVMSCPVDESPYGVYDMAGNTAEWVDDWYAEEQGLRLLAGGSWGQTDKRLFEIFGGQGLPPAAAGTETGFRLVARRREGPR